MPGSLGSVTTLVGRTWQLMPPARTTLPLLPCLLPHPPSPRWVPNSCVLMHWPMPTVTSISYSFPSFRRPDAPTGVHPLILLGPLSLCSFSSTFPFPLPRLTHSPAFPGVLSTTVLPMIPHTKMPPHASPYSLPPGYSPPQCCQ